MSQESGVRREKIGGTGTGKKGTTYVRRLTFMATMTEMSNDEKTWQWAWNADADPQDIYKKNSTLFSIVYRWMTMHRAATKGVETFI